MADYHSLLMRAVASLPNAGTPATREVIYGRARKALLEQLRSLRPPLPESDIAREEKALDAAIAEIEKTYGSRHPDPPVAPPTPTSPATGKPGGAPAPKTAPPSPPQLATILRPHAASAPHPAPPNASVQAAAARRLPPSAQGRSQPAGSPPRAPAPPAGKPAAAAPAAALSPARSPLAAAMGHSLSFGSETRGGD